MNWVGLCLKDPTPQLHPVWLPYASTVFSNLPSLCPFISFMLYLHSSHFQCPGYPQGPSYPKFCRHLPTFYLASPINHHLLDWHPHRPSGPDWPHLSHRIFPAEGAVGPLPAPAGKLRGNTWSSSLQDPPLPFSPSPANRHHTDPPHGHQNRLLRVSVGRGLQRRQKGVSLLNVGVSRGRRPRRPRAEPGRSPRCRGKGGWR